MSYGIFKTEALRLAATGDMWTASNPVLPNGAIGAELDTNKVKIGDGVHTWTQLSYFSASSSYTLPAATSSVLGGITVSNGLSITSGGALSAQVLSVAGRTGAITLSVSDITGAAPLASPTFTGTTTAATLKVTGTSVLSNGYTVATLPAASSSLTGARAYVTDATSPTFMGALTGGGNVVCPVFCNGTAWVAA